MMKIFFTSMLVSLFSVSAISDNKCDGDYKFCCKKRIDPNFDGNGSCMCGEKVANPWFDDCALSSQKQKQPAKLIPPPKPGAKRKCFYTGLRSRCGNAEQVRCEGFMDDRNLYVKEDVKVTGLKLDLFGISETNCKKFGGTKSKNTEGRCNDMITLKTEQPISVGNASVAVSWYQQHLSSGYNPSVTGEIKTAWDALGATFTPEVLALFSSSKKINFEPGSFEIDPAIKLYSNLSCTTPAADVEVRQ